MKMWKRHSTLALFALIGVLLPVLAYLQYHWLGELSRLEQQHRADTLAPPGHGFSVYTPEIFASTGSRRSRQPQPSIDGSCM